MPNCYDSSKPPSSKLHFEEQSQSNNKPGHNTLDTKTF